MNDVLAAAPAHAPGSRGAQCSSVPAPTLSRAPLRAKSARPPAMSPRAASASPRCERRHGARCCDPACRRARRPRSAGHCSSCRCGHGRRRTSVASRFAARGRELVDDDRSGHGQCRLGHERLLAERAAAPGLAVQAMAGVGGRQRIQRQLVAHGAASAPALDFLHASLRRVKSPTMPKSSIVPPSGCDGPPPSGITARHGRMPPCLDGRDRGRGRRRAGAEHIRTEWGRRCWRAWWVHWRHWRSEDRVGAFVVRVAPVIQIQVRTAAAPGFKRRRRWRDCSARLLPVTVAPLTHALHTLRVIRGELSFVRLADDRQLATSL